MRSELDERERREVGRKAREAVLVALRALGGEATRHCVLERARCDGGFTDRELTAPAPMRGYPTFVDYRLSWALSNLKRYDMVENPRWSVWRLKNRTIDDPVQATTECVSAERLAELRSMRYCDYIRTPEWRSTRGAALAQAEHRCQLDRSHTTDLEVHHNTYERVGAELASDLVVLCHSRHQLHHRENGRPRRSSTYPAANRARAASSIAPPAPQSAVSSTTVSPRRLLLRRLLRIT